MVDADDAFDPESAAANGINLRQLLWVRCRKSASPFVNGIHKTIRATRQACAPPIYCCRQVDLLHRARPGRHRGRACSANPAGHLVSFSSCGRSLTHLPGCGGSRWLRPVQRRRSSRMCALHPITAGDSVLRAFTLKCGAKGNVFSPIVMGQKKPPAVYGQPPEHGIRSNAHEAELFACVHARSFHRRLCCVCAPICSLFLSPFSMARLLRRSAP